MPRAALGAGAVVLIAVGAVLAYLSLTSAGAPFGPGLTSATPNAGQAATQFGSVGFRLQVAGRSRSAGILRLSLVFRNTSAQQQRADPADFRLEAGSRRAAPVFADGCPNWGRVDLYPAGSPPGEPLRDAGGTRAGAVWGPSALCFADPGPSPALTLIWEPDVAFGPLSEPIRIPLR